jgi:ribosomal protein S8
MKRGCLIVILIVVLLTAFFVYVTSTSFNPVYDNAEIKQNIGGKLICNSVYIADHHSWQYNVTYKYKQDNDSVIDIGEGTYYGREWNKNEQLTNYKTWTILKTGGGYVTDKIIIGNLKTGQRKEYEFTPTILKQTVFG